MLSVPNIDCSLRHVEVCRPCHNFPWIIPVQLPKHWARGIQFAINRITLMDLKAPQPFGRSVGIFHLLILRVQRFAVAAPVCTQCIRTRILIAYFHVCFPHQTGSRHSHPNSAHVAHVLKLYMCVSTSGTHGTRERRTQRGSTCSP